MTQYCNATNRISDMFIAMIEDMIIRGVSIEDMPIILNSILFSCIL